MEMFGALDLAMSFDGCRFANRNQKRQQYAIPVGIHGRAASVRVSQSRNRAIVFLSSLLFLHSVPSSQIESHFWRSGRLAGNSEGTGQGGLPATRARSLRAVSEGPRCKRAARFWCGAEPTTTTEFPIRTPSTTVVRSDPDPRVWGGFFYGADDPNECKILFQV